MRAIFFHAFSMMACLFALAAITRKNPVHSALMLVLALLALAVDYAVLGATFLAAAQVFVYAGAIVVLFVFVIILVGTRPEQVGARARSGWLLGAVIAVLAAAVLMAKLTPWAEIVLLTRETSPEQLALALIGTRGILGPFAFAFELGSVLVLVAMISAFMLSRRRG